MLQLLACCSNDGGTARRAPDGLCRFNGHGRRALAWSRVQHGSFSVMVLYVGVLTTGVCEDCAAKLLTPARLRFNSESADDEHTARGQRLVAAEHEVLIHGGSLGEGTELFGMVPTQGGRGSLTAAGGGLGRGDSAAAVGGRIDTAAGVANGALA